MIVEHRVYWSEMVNLPVGGTRVIANVKDFGKGELGLALKFCEELRQDRAKGAPISFITCADEISDCTSLAGSSAPAADYEWKKYRLNRNETPR